MKPDTNDEKILVIKRELILDANGFQGFLPVNDFNSYQQCILKHQEYFWRSEMENNPSYKQIIPYLIFKHNDTFFIMQRKSTASETRLKNKYSLGIGGHIRQEDLGVGGTLQAWAHREFEEEVSFDGTLTIHPLGLINDDSNAVGQVHIGFAFLLEGSSSSIAIKSEHKEGKLLTLEQLRPLYDNMEHWSQLVFDYVYQIQILTAPSNHMATKHKEIL